jgi:hypothetical protein
MPAAVCVMTAKFLHCLPACCPAVCGARLDAQHHCGHAGLHRA